jgi:hypothetical protein
MHIREIHIENVRCFGEKEQGVHLDLTRPDGSLAGWTVLAGRNGSGKSTLLKAIALSVAGPGRAPSLQTSFVDWIREGQSAARVSTVLASGSSLQTPAKFTTRIEWRRVPGGEEPDLQGASTLDPLKLPYQGPWSSNPAGWFIAGYGPFRRLGYRDDYSRRSLASLTSLFDEDVTLAESIQWLQYIHAVRLELKAASDDPKLGTQMQAQANGLNELCDNVLALLNDGLLPEGVSIDRLDTAGLWVKQNGVSLRLRNLSDGYRAAVTLAFDIVRWMNHYYGGNLNIQRCDHDGKTVVQVLHEGVVLIDEVDAHLHVSWQQRIGFWLKEHFPKVQFIVTTHSPFICQAADPKGLIRLPAPDSNEPVAHVSDDLFNTVVYGDADDAVMTALFGLERPHSDKAERLRRRVAQLEAKHIRGSATPAEQEELKRLSALLPKTGSALVEQALRKLSESS